MIIAIDGPAGSGKTTIAKLLAKKLNISYLDTGATYRSLTYFALEKKVDLSSEEDLWFLAKQLKLKMHSERIYLFDKDITDEIRTPLIDKNISQVVSFPKVREAMVTLQRKIAAKGDFVVEGRDITTVVFPEAEYKFYLDADFSERVTRRFKELTTKGIKITRFELEKDMEKRDRADKTRKVGALKKHPDAICIDTTDLKIEEVINKISSYIK